MIINDGVSGRIWAEQVAQEYRVCLVDAKPGLDLNQDVEEEEEETENKSGV